MKADLLLLRPRGKKSHGQIFATEQLGLSYLASSVRKAGYSVKILDGFLEPEAYESLLDEVSDGDYRLIGFPVYQETVARVGKDVRRMRRNGLITTHVTVGNHLATLLDRQVLEEFPEFDSAIRGEGEHTIVELLAAIVSGRPLGEVLGLSYIAKGEFRRNPSRGNESNLDKLPFPARDTLPLVLNAGNAPLLYSSRGCNARCSFCSVHEFFNASINGQWRGRSAKNVVDEIEILIREFGVDTIAFADEQFLGHGMEGKERALRIAQEIIDRHIDVRWYIETRSSDVEPELFERLRESGLSSVFMGVESGYDPALRQLNKGIRSRTHERAIRVLLDLEILPTLGFIMFRPQSTIEEIKYNLKFLKQVDCGEITMLSTVLKVYAGTQLWRDMGSPTELRQPIRHDMTGYFDDSLVGKVCSTFIGNADVYSVLYNEFSALRRSGKLSFGELISLQRTINGKVIQYSQAFLEDAVIVEDVTRAMADSYRSRLIDSSQDLLRLVRFADVVSSRRDGIILKNPMAHCA